MEELNRIKAGAKWMWSLGDYAAVAELLEPYARELANDAGISPGARVLDVGAGNGNFALAAAALGASVTACDVTPHMLELGRARSATARVAIDWLEGDAEDLPFGDGQFDFVGSVFAAQFAPRPELVARELFRVCAPGGVVVMANYSPVGFLAQMSELLRRYSSAPAVELPSPFRWGVPSALRQRLGDVAAELEMEESQLTMRFESLEAGLDFWERTNSPMIALRNMLDAERYASLRRDTHELMRSLNGARDGRLELKSGYVKVLARRASA